VHVHLIAECDRFFDEALHKLLLTTLGVCQIA